MSSKFPVFLGLGLVVATGAAMSWILSRRKKWVAVGKLSKIYIYPLKSGKYKEITEGECTPLGLRYELGDNKMAIRDRVFVVYNGETMAFLSGKIYPKLLEVNVEPKDDKIVIFSYPEKESLEITLHDEFDDKKIELWDNEKIRINDCGDKAAKWISKVLDSNNDVYRIGYWPEKEKTWRRDISYRTLEFKVFKYMRNEHTGAYSDISSYNMLCESSLQDLNNKVADEDKTDPLYYRPNFLIEGTEAYAEDKWHWIKIGDAIFESFRPCTRCIFTTVNPSTGVKNKHNEPLTTLRKYRTMKMLGWGKVDPHIPVMGLYAGLEQGGKIKCGDTVYVSN